MSNAMVRLDDLNATLPFMCAGCRQQIESLKTFAAPTKALNALEGLLAQVALETGLSPELIRNRDRSRMRVKARRRFCVAASKKGYSSVEIATFLGRHHTSVLHLLGRTERKHAKAA